MGPPGAIVIALSILFGTLATLLMVVAIATDKWEWSTFKAEHLKNVPGIVLNSSILNEDEGFFKVVITKSVSGNSTNVNYYMRSTYGGIWHYCDVISDGFRETEAFKAAVKEVPYFDHHCVNYIPDFGPLKDYLDSEGKSLLRMQNSAASCSIVSVLCVLTAILTGAVALSQKQVSACMVTGVMHIVAGVFACFATILLITKVSYMRNDCYSLEPFNHELCESRQCRVGWSVPIGWAAFTFFLLAFVCWLYLARCFRLEKAKSIL